MKRLVRWLLVLVAVGAFGFSALLLLKDDIARNIAQRELQSQTQLPIQIGRLKVDLRKQQLSAADIELPASQRPSGLVAAKISKATADCDFAGLVKHQLHFKSLAIDLDSLEWAGNWNGPGQNTKGPVATNSAQHRLERLRAAVWKFDGIDLLTVHLGKITYRPSRSADELQIIDFQGSVKTLSNVTSLQQIDDWILEILLQHGISIPGR